MARDTFVCSRCKARKPIQKEGGTGYGRTRSGKRVCYACCGETEAREMARTGRAVLYYTEHQEGPVPFEVSNWPGTLRVIPHSVIPHSVKYGKHNMAGVRMDVWFTFQGREWHGVNLGRMNQILRCKRIGG